MWKKIVWTLEPCVENFRVLIEEGRVMKKENGEYAISDLALSDLRFFAGEDADSIRSRCTRQNFIMALPNFIWNQS